MPANWRWKDDGISTVSSCPLHHLLVETLGGPVARLRRAVPSAVLDKGSTRLRSVVNVGHGTGSMGACQVESKLLTGTNRFANKRQLLTLFRIVII